MVPAAGDVDSPRGGRAGPGAAEAAVLPASRAAGPECVPAGGLPPVRRRRSRGPGALRRDRVRPDHPEPALARRGPPDPRAPGRRAPHGPDHRVVRPLTRPLQPLFDVIMAADLATDAEGRCKNNRLENPSLLSVHDYLAGQLASLLKKVPTKENQEALEALEKCISCAVNLSNYMHFIDGFQTPNQYQAAKKQEQNLMHTLHASEACKEPSFQELTQSMEGMLSQLKISGEFQGHTLEEYIVLFNKLKKDAFPNALKDSAMNGYIAFHWKNILNKKVTYVNSSIFQQLSELTFTTFPSGHVNFYQLGLKALKTELERLDAKGDSGKDKAERIRKAMAEVPINERRNLFQEPISDSRKKVLTLLKEKRPSKLTGNFFSSKTPKASEASKAYKNLEAEMKKLFQEEDSPRPSS